MKISNSKKELARIISENGGWRDGDYAIQDKDDMRVWFTHGIKGKPCGNPYWPCNKSHSIEHHSLLPNWHQTILSRAEYFHLYPSPDAVKPTDFGAIGDDETNLAVKDGLESMEYRPTIEQLAADYRNKLDYAERKQQEADAAKADADARLKTLELAGEAIGLLVSPITAKQEPDLVITDWRQLKVGDLVEITTTRDGVNIGEAATIIAIDENNEYFRVTVTFPGDKYPLEYSYERPPTTWRFIRRP